MACIALMPKMQESVFSYVSRLCRSVGSGESEPYRFGPMQHKDWPCTNETLFSCLGRLVGR